LGHWNLVAVSTMGGNDRADFVSAKAGSKEDEACEKEQRRQRHLGCRRVAREINAHGESSEICCG
jgi:hypothetical protein